MKTAIISTNKVKLYCLCSRHWIDFLWLSVMCFSKVAENVQKRALCPTSRSSDLSMFYKVFYVITQNQTELQSSKLLWIDTDCTQTAQKIQTPLYVHVEVTFICTFLAYCILRITGNFPYNLYSPLICCRTSVNTRRRQSRTLKACFTLRTGTFSIMSSTLKGIHT